MTIIRSVRTFRVWTPFRFFYEQIDRPQYSLGRKSEKLVKKMSSEDPDLVAMCFQFSEAWIIRRTERLEAKPNQGLRDDQH